ncbi:MAG: signal peptide peptidase SppA [Phycisphaerales bacterium]|nr:signal peptide peptidase SppA [Phycisphaerales bacterium]
MRNHITAVALLCALFTAVGCMPYRFVIDVTSPTEELTESVILRDRGASRWGQAKIAMIDLNGTFADRQSSSVLTPPRNPVSEFVERLREAEEDDAVRAIIVRINSPGGTVAASETLYQELCAFRERSGKPIVILMGEVAASGGYYVALAGDELIAQPTTVTGSIGVLIQLVNISDTMRMLGIRARAVTSGPNKAMGSPFEPEESEHRAIFQRIVDEFYASFCALVVERRPNIQPELLAGATDGRVMTGTQAAQIGLIDRTGTLRDAFDAAKHRAGLTSAKLVKYHRPSEHIATPYAVTGSAQPTAASHQVNLIQVNLSELPGMTSGFYYLWDPTLDAE